MRTIERNYRKNPHTARFLQAFHTGGGNLPADSPMTAEARCLECQGFHQGGASCAEDLLDAVPVDAVPVDAPAWSPSPAQVALISKLVLEINALDTEKGEAAASYTARMDRAGAWTRQNTTRWIGNMIKMSRELNEARRSATPPAVPDGRYAVEVDGALRFYKVKNGRKAGFVFLDVRASDEWYPIRKMDRLRAIVALIARDPKAAMIRYGQELGQCGHCGRVLTDAASRAAGIGPVCAGR